MPWVRIDDKAMHHPKIARLDDGAFRLWVQGLAHCQMFLTDGRIPREAVELLSAFTPERAQKLVAVKLWQPYSRGFRVHDFLEWNDSRGDVISARESARIRMRQRRERSREQVSTRSGEQVEGVRGTVGGWVGGTGGTSERGTGKTAKPAPAKVAFDGSRLRVWHWQHEDLGKRLGAKASDFDLLGWYARLNAELETSGESYADPWKWLQEQLYLDAELPLPNLMGREVHAKSKLTRALEKASKW